MTINHKPSQSSAVQGGRWDLNISCIWSSHRCLNFFIHSFCHATWFSLYIYIAVKQYSLRKKNSLNSRGPFQILDSLLFLSLAPKKDKHGFPVQKQKKRQWKPPIHRGSPAQLRGDVANYHGSRGELFAQLDPDDDEGFDQARPWWYTGMWCLVDKTTVYVSCCWSPQQFSQCELYYQILQVVIQ